MFWRLKARVCKLGILVSVWDSCNYVLKQKSLKCFEPTNSQAGKGAVITGPIAKDLPQF